MIYYLMMTSVLKTRRLWFKILLIFTFARVHDTSVLVLLRRYSSVVGVFCTLIES